MKPSRGVDVVLCTPDLGDGGTQRVVANLANAWSRRGLRVAVITVFDDECAFALDDQVERVHLRIPLGTRRKSAAGMTSSPLIRAAAHRGRAAMAIPTGTWMLRRALRRLQPERVVSFLVSVNVMTILASLGERWQLVISERDDPTRQKLPFPWPELRRRLYRRAGVVTANSRGALEAMRAYVDAHKLSFVPNPVMIGPETEEGTQLHAPPGPVFLTVARLHQQKALDVLLGAVARLPASLADWRLVVVGEGELRAALQSLAVELGIEGRVEWVGRVLDPLSYYRAASVFVLPSRHEGMPNALIEAMGTGMPVVVSDASGGSLELVEHDISGLVVPVDQVDELARALGRLAHDAALRARLGRAGRARVQPFALPRALSVWDEVLGLGGPTSPSTSG